MYSGPPFHVLWLKGYPPLLSNFNSPKPLPHCQISINNIFNSPKPLSYCQISINNIFIGWVFKSRVPKINSQGEFHFVSIYILRTHFSTHPFLTLLCRECTDNTFTSMWERHKISDCTNSAGKDSYTLVQNLKRHWEQLFPRYPNGWHYGLHSRISTKFQRPWLITACSFIKKM